MDTVVALLARIEDSQLSDEVREMSESSFAALVLGFNREAAEAATNLTQSAESYKDSAFFIVSILSEYERRTQYKPSWHKDETIDSRWYIRGILLSNIVDAVVRILEAHE